MYLGGWRNKSEDILLEGAIEIVVTLFIVEKVSAPTQKGDFSF